MTVFGTLIFSIAFASLANSDWHCSLKKDGCALEDVAMNYRLCETGLPIDSIEGRNAFKVYGKQLGHNGFELSPSEFSGGKESNQFLTY